MSRRGNQKGTTTAAKPEVAPHTSDSPRRLRASELPGAIPITDRVRIVAALNRDALLDALAKAIFNQDSTATAPLQSAVPPISKSA